MAEAKSPRKLKGTEKAAIFLIALGSADSAHVLKHLPEDEADQIAKAVARLDQVDSDQVEQILEEFHQFATSQKLLVRGGVEYAQKMLAEAFGPETATRLIDRLGKSLEGDLAVFDNFRRVDPQQLAKFVQDEHPQTIALILSHLDAAQAARLLSALPADSRQEIAIRMADLEEISPEVVRNIARVIEQRLRNLGELSREQLGGVRSVANMFNRLDPNTCTQLLTKLETDSPTLFESVRRFMFVFRDLEVMDETSIKMLISKVDRKALVLALKGANESLREKFVATQSARGAEMLNEDIASTGPVKLKDVDAAQQQIISMARQLEKEGLLSLSSSGADQMID